MESPRTYRASAIILRRINIGETDRIVTLYTREKGKLSSIAKGARRHLSKLAGATELFTYGKYFLASGRDLDIITQTEVKESFPEIRKNLDRIAHAAYICEMVNIFVEEREANYGIFDTLLSALYLLESGVDPKVVARYFELNLMSMMGYRPELDQCIRCSAHPSGDGMYFSPSMGGRVCKECGPLPDDVIHLNKETADAMRILLAAEPGVLRMLEFSEEVKQELFKIIHLYIRYRTGRDLKSLEFIHILGSKAKG